MWTHSVGNSRGALILIPCAFTVANWRGKEVSKEVNKNNNNKNLDSVDRSLVAIKENSHAHLHNLDRFLLRQVGSVVLPQQRDRNVRSVTVFHVVTS